MRKAIFLPLICICFYFLSCISNPVTLDNFSVDKKPANLYLSLLTSMIPGASQLINGEYVEAAVYAGAFVVPIAALGIMGEGAPDWMYEAAIGVVGATVLFSLADGLLSPAFRHGQYDYFNKRLTNAADDLDLEEAVIEPLYPSLYKFYETHPAGKLSLINDSLWEMEDIRVSLFVPGFMDYPKETVISESLQTGETADIDLFILFNSTVLGVEENIDLSAELDVSFQIFDQDKLKTGTVPIHLLKRNTMGWDDPGKLSSFITAKDLPVKAFTRNTVQSLAPARIGAVNDKFQVAMQVFAALTVYGMVLEETVDLGPGGKLREIWKIRPGHRSPGQSFDFAAGLSLCPYQRREYLFPAG